MIIYIDMYVSVSEYVIVGKCYTCKIGQLSCSQSGNFEVAHKPQNTRSIYIYYTCSTCHINQPEDWKATSQCNPKISHVLQTQEQTAVVVIDQHKGLKRADDVVGETQHTRFGDKYLQRELFTFASQEQSKYLKENRWGHTLRCYIVKGSQGC